MALGTFNVTIDADQLGAGTETSARLQVQFGSGRTFIKDDAGGKFVFPHVSNTAPQAISLPHTLELETDVSTGESASIGYVVTVTTASGGRVVAGPFAAKATGTTVALTALASDFEGLVPESIAVRAETAAADAEASAASIQREQPNGVAGLDATGKLYTSRIPDTLQREQVNGVAGLDGAGKLYETRIPTRLSQTTLDDTYATKVSLTTKLSVNEAPLSPFRYGAIGDGVADDTIPLQTTLDALSSATGQKALLQGYFRVTAPIAFRSGTVIEGGSRRAAIEQVTPNTPCLVSVNWRDNYAPAGKSEVRNLALLAPTGANAHALILRDYYSVIDNVDIAGAGGDGIRITHLSQNGTAVAGSLVENSVSNVTVKNCGGISLHLGALDNAKITDGRLTNFWVGGGGGTAANHLMVGASAGWQIDNGHLYGGCTADAAHIANAFHTSVDQLYVETGYGGSPIFFDRHQRASTLSNLTAMMEDRDAIAAVKFTKSGFSAGDGMTISNVAMTQNFNRTTAVVDTSDPNSPIEVAGLAFAGTYKRVISPAFGAGLDAVKIARSAATVTWSGSGAKSFDFLVMPPAVGYSRVGTLMIHGATNGYQAQQVVYRGQWAYSRAAAGTGVYLNNIVAPTGFSAAPAVSVPQVGVVRVTFTPTASGVFGGTCTLQ